MKIGALSWSKTVAGCYLKHACPQINLRCVKTNNPKVMKTNPSAKADSSWIGADVFEDNRNLLGLHHLISALRQMYRMQLEHL